MKKYNVAVVGATGNVGREILNILDFRSFPINKVFALASSKSEGLKIIYGNDKEMKITPKQLEQIIKEELSSVRDLDVKDVQAALSGENDEALEQNLQALTKKVEDLEKALVDMKKAYTNSISRNTAVLDRQ